MQVDYNDIITPSVARGLASYIEGVYKLVNNDDKFFSCLPSIIIEYGYSTNAHDLAQQIREHG